MHPDRARRAEPAEDFDRIDRPDMAPRRHLPGGEAERADRDQREPDRAIARRLVRPFEIARAGIAREEQIAARRQLDDEARPERAVAVG